MQAKTPLLPVIVVGKDRTRMTCAVIDHLKEHIKNATPYFICVSDRSRPGHDKVVENHMKKLGETEYEVLRTLPEKNRYGWGCAINLGLQCAFDSCPDATFALVVDNDWLLQRDLDMEKYDYAFALSEIGAVTFKSVNPGTNVTLAERKLDDGSIFLLRDKGTAPRYSFTAEIGCMLITRRMVESCASSSNSPDVRALLGLTSPFKENCRTDETEWAFCDWYNSLSPQERSDSRLWFATDKDLFHEELNGENHVFTHVGLVSQHEGPHKWDCPDEYKYLSDDSADEQVCKGAVMNDLLTIDDTAATNDGNYWKRHKVLFATNFDEDTNCPLTLSLQILRRISGEDNVYVCPPEKFGREAFFDIFSYAINHGYEYVVYSDADNFIVSEENLRLEFSDFLSDGSLMFSGPTDGGTFFHRNGSAYVINPFLLFVRIALIRKYYDATLDTFSFPEKSILSRNSVSQKTRESSQDVIDSWREYREKFGINLPISKEIARGTTDPILCFWFGKQWSPYAIDESQISKEPYYDIFIGACKDGADNQYMFACDYVFEPDKSGITSAIFHFDRQSPYRDYGDESNLICVHTWFSRAYLPNQDISNDAIRRWQTDRIARVAAWVNERVSVEDKSNVDTEYGRIEWSKHFDRIYCIHHLPQKNKLARLKEELKRVGIMGSGIFEFRYTSPTRYDAELLPFLIKAIRSPAIVNIALETMRIVKEAREFGYKKILVLENDVAFLKNLSRIKDELSAIPCDANIVQFDKFIDNFQIPIWDELCKSSPEGSRFVDATGRQFTSAACYAIMNDGIEFWAKELERNLQSPDILFTSTPKRYISRKNLAIQVYYEGCWTLDESLDTSHQELLYKNAGVNMEEYCLPSGYGKGCVFLKDGRLRAPVDNSGSAATPSCDKALHAEVAYSPYPQHRKFISVYAIAKNEASVARRWYDCVKEADEVCVLDTGSTDETVEILRSLGAKVTVKTYEDWSFAVARNDSMSLVSPEADILFTLDLDETIAPGWRKKLEDAWIEREQSGIAPTGCVYKYIWSFNPDGTEAQSFSVRKIHAKGQGKWKYRCHELLTEVDDKRAFFLDDFVVEHHQNRQTNRSKYLPLLKKDAKEMPDDDRSAYYYARELMYLGRWQESLDEFKRHLSLPSARWAAERASSMRNIASCYGQLGNKELCELWLRKSADEDPTNREATFRLGEIAMEQKDYPAAVAAFRRCLAIEKPSLEYISIPIVWSARPWFLYAQALWWTGDWEGAEEASRKALEIEPNNPEVHSQYEGMAATRKKFNR